MLRFNSAGIGMLGNNCLMTNLFKSRAKPPVRKLFNQIVMQPDRALIDMTDLGAHYPLVFFKGKSNTDVTK
jgi:hypothetical protein